MLGINRRLKLDFFSNALWSCVEIWKFNKLFFFIMIINYIIEGVFSPLTLIVTQRMIDCLQLGERYFKSAFIWLGILITANLFKENIGYFMGIKIQKYEYDFDVYIQDKIYHKVSNLKCNDYEESNVHDLVNRTQYDLNASVLENSKLLFSVASIMISFGSYTAILIDYNIILVLLLYCIPILRFIFEKNFNIKEYSFIKRNTEKNRKIGYLTSLITNADFFKELKLFGLFSHFRKNIIELKNGYNIDLINIKKQRLKIYSIVSLVESGVTFFIIMWIMADVIKGHLLIGQFILYTGAMNSLNENIIRCLSYISQLCRNSVIIDDVRSFFQEVKKVKSLEKNMLI